MSLRLIVAIALVATALSAPTWTKQLGMLATNSNTAADINNCHCTDCKDPFEFYGGEVGEQLSFDQCKERCTNNNHASRVTKDRECLFALYDSAYGNVRGNPNTSNPSGTHHRCWLYNHLPSASEAATSTYVEVGNGHCVDSSNKRPPHCYTHDGSISDENTCKSACTAVSGCSAYEWGQTGGYCQLIWTTGISSLNNAQHSATTGSCSSSVLNNWKYNLNGDSNYAGGAIQQTYHNTGGKCYRKEGGEDNQYKCFTMGTYAPTTRAPVPVPSVAPQGSAQYQYSDLGSNSCPSGCSAINDLQTCKNTLSDAQSMNPAASQLGGNTAGTGSGGNYGSGRPGGCFLHNPNKHIHFNTDSTGGNSHGDDYKICKC